MVLIKSATQISGAFDTVSSSLSDRLQIAETELENTLISGSEQLASEISGAFTVVLSLMEQSVVHQPQLVRLERY